MPGQIFQAGVTGIGNGAIYALIALGIVMVYRGSGVINFAQGAVGMAATYLYWELYNQDGWGFVPAFVTALAFCAVLGVAIQLLVMRPLRNQTPLARMLATLGILVTLQQVVTTLAPAVSQALPITESLPQTSYSLFGATIAWDWTLIAIFSLVLAVAVWLVYRFTKFGLATSAVAENRRAAGTLGLPLDLIASANWAIGLMLAGVAGILISPATSASVTSLTILVIPALAAAVVGRMQSFPITYVAGILLGVAQAEMTRWLSIISGTFLGFNGQSWQIIEEALPFFVIIVVLALRGRTLPDRAERGIRLPKVGTGVIHPSYVLVAAAVTLACIMTMSVNWVEGITTTMLAGILILSLIVVTGYAGQLSLAQLTLAGIGAFIAARLASSDHVGFGLALVFGVLGTLPVGLAVGLPALRTRGVNLGIATLALSAAAYDLIFENGAYAGGATGGISVAPARLFGANISELSYPRAFSVTVLGFFVAAALVVANIRRGRTGRRLLAVRANERAAASLGIGVMSSKLYAFGIAAMIAALGGVLLAFRSTVVELGNFDPLDSVNVVTQGVIGGLGFVPGAAFGSQLQAGGVGTQVGNLFGASIASYLVLAGGVILILMLIFNPDGIAKQACDHAGAAARALGRSLRRLPGLGRLVPARAGGGFELPTARPSAVGAAEHGRVSAKILETRDLGVAFGGSRALAGVSLQVRPGEVVGLIGPNGAGKTTFIDAVTGFVRTDGGEVLLDGRPITSLSPRRRSQLGLARSFQSLELFDDLTVGENLVVGSDSGSRWSLVGDLVWPKRSSLRPATLSFIEQFDLLEVLHRLPPELPAGKRRLVGIVRALTIEPSVLMLDEPAAGLSQVERRELTDLLRHLAEVRGLAVLLVEHDVELVMRTCDRIVTLDFGTVIAEGRPAEIRADPIVMKAYLGEELTDGGEPREPAGVASGDGRAGVEGAAR